MSAADVQGVSSTSSPDDVGGQTGRPLQTQPAREKTKRPQLSCNPCRTRKVKCDRVQPCTACSLHQIADSCHYDLTEAERHPILQAEALREKDKEIARLRRQIEILGGGQSIKSEDGPSGHASQESGVVPKVPKKPVNLRQKRLHKGEIADSIYFGTPGMASVIEEFANLSVDSKAANLTHSVPRSTDIYAFQMATSHPFPTLWPAKDGVSGLVQLLPSKDEIIDSLEIFHHRVQSCSFPHVPEECTKKEVERFLANSEHNAHVHPDMLALLFATLAQCSQNGVYDKSGGKWVAGAMEEESKKGDVYIAAAMQALRMASFMNRPSLLAVETLILIGPYLTNSGKFLDAWALFGITVRLAQSIGLHRDPSQLNPPPPLGEVMARKNIWWWMLHMDQQYSMTLGRPLGISSMGDCPAPELLIPNPVIQSLSNYIGQFTILSRQIMSAGYLNNHQIDLYTDQLLALKETLPELILFDETWLDEQKPLPPWPLDAQAAVFYGKTHNLLILLNRQRLENTRYEKDSAVDLMAEFSSGDREQVPRGRERVLRSCRALLDALEFFHSRLRVAMLCWTMGQQAFNAAMILTLSMLETGDTQDLGVVQQTYSTFLEMNRLGIHKLAGAAVEKLGGLMKEFQSGELPKETVMGKQGMMLLEDPGLQGFLPGGFTPLNFQMAGSSIPFTNAGTGWAASGAGGSTTTERPVGLPSPPLPAGKKRQRKTVTGSGLKPRVPVKKSSLKQRLSPSQQHRRASGLWMTEGSQAGPLEISPTTSEPPFSSDFPTTKVEHVGGDDQATSLSSHGYGLGMPTGVHYQPQNSGYESTSEKPTFQRTSSYGRLDTALSNYQSQVHPDTEMHEPMMGYHQEQSFYGGHSMDESAFRQAAGEQVPKQSGYFQNPYEQVGPGGPASTLIPGEQGRDEGAYHQGVLPGGYGDFLGEDVSRSWGWPGYTPRG